MRDALRTALRGLTGPRLGAAFGGAAGAAFDIENVLFYNVGCSAFRACSGAELYFERRFIASSAPSGRNWACSHEYRTGSFARSWAARDPGIQFRLSGDGPLPATAARYWAATHRARVDDGDRLPATAPLSLKLELSSTRPVNLTEVVKKATDGICAALHSYEGPSLSEVSGRASNLLEIDAETTARWMTRPGALGPRRFVWPFGRHLQWSPADDRLVAVEMTWERGDSSNWSVAVALSEAAPTAGSARSVAQL